MSKLGDFLKGLVNGDPEKQKLIDEIESEQQSSKNQEPKEINNPVFSQDKKDLDPETKAMIAKLLEDNKKLMDLINQSQIKEKEREEILKVQAQKELQTKINKLIEEAKADGRIPPQNSEELKKWQGLLEKDYESGEFALSKLKKEADNTQIQGNKIAIDTKLPIDRAQLIEQAKQSFKTN